MFFNTLFNSTRFVNTPQRILFILSLLVYASLFGCSSEEAATGNTSQANYTYTNIDFAKLQRRQKVYVPAYSDIYHLDGDKRFLLTVTAVVRNPSMRDTMYVNSVDYYSSTGELLRKYLQKTLTIQPLASAEFIVEYLEKQGGAGASFVIDWGSNSLTVKPVIQAVMIGTLSQQGISFLTEGVVIETSPDSVATP